MEVGDRVIYIDGNKSTKGLVKEINEICDGQVNWIILWDNGRKILYTIDQMDKLIGKIKLDFQYYRTIKLEELGI